MNRPPSSATNSGSGFFIVSTSLDKPDAETRKLIRSHVMRGKNTRKSKRAKELAGHADSSRNDRDELQKEGQQRDEVHWMLMPPKKIASELSLFGYAVEMKPYMLDLIHKAFTIVKPNTYTVEIVLVDGPRSDMFCFADFPKHPALLHSVLFTSQAFYDFSCGHPYGKTAQLHLAKTLYHLQKSLGDQKEATADSTLIVVLSLATAAALLGDPETVKKHMSGLYRMIELRGGLGTFAEGSMIVHKAERIDFGLALSSGNKMHFMQEITSWEPQIARGIDAAKLPELSMVKPPLDPRLLNIWADLRVFTKAANEASKTGIRMPQDLFSRLSSTVPSRLLSLRFDPTSFAELLRLCMLACMKSILIQISGLGPQIKHLKACLERSLLAQQYPPTPEYAKVFFWALFISTLSIFEKLEEDWLRDALFQTASSLGCHTWIETRAILKEFLWIDIVYNEPGKQLFNQLLSPDRTQWRG